MRYPVDNFKTEWNTTAGLSFGAKTNYGYHEGVDINDNGGGNSDLGKEVYSIANGELQYWHGAKHPNSGFGYHSVYKISGQFGTRWIHQTHMQPDLTQAPKAVTENEVIGHVGNSGTTWAHIHFAIFKVDPATLRDGIDTIARTEKELNEWWENPLPFIDRWMNSWTHENQQKLIDELRIERDKNWNLYQDQIKKTSEIQKQYDELKKNKINPETVNSLEETINILRSELKESDNKMRQIHNLSDLNAL